MTKNSDRYKYEAVADIPLSKTTQLLAENYLLVFINSFQHKNV